MCMMMKKLIYLLLLALMPLTAAAYKLQRISVHDPSIVWEPESQTYYIFGSHRGSASTTDLMSWKSLKAPWKTATSNNASNSAAFKTNQTTTITIGGQEVAFGNFDAHAWSAAIAKNDDGDSWNIDGNMWAPDVIYNKAMQKWCMYLSINGFKWNSSIILLTADNIRGPYMYQGPVVYSGFNVTSAAGTDYKLTDLQLAIGEQTSLPARYNVGNNWGRRWPHCIDPCVFYDEDGQLWMSYGSWSGGIWILKLNNETGLRDYDTTYPSTNGNSDGVTSDPYFGKKIAGGYYVSGEASYIEHIGNYYFLFVSYGFFDSTGGYQMRVFRSENPNGPYKDASGASAIFDKYMMNYGPKSKNCGVNIFGAYGDWGYQTVGGMAERSQGHNSIIDAEDGRTYLVYHTRFQNYPNNAEAHQVRVHQVFQNADGWLVAAPFEYTGEEVTNADIATTQQIATSKIPGTYRMLIHSYGLDHANKALAEPLEIQLNANGTISGSRTGTWRITEGTSYSTIKLSTTEYKGVLVEQTLEPKDEKAAAFTAMARNGVTIWGYMSESAGYTGIETPPLTPPLRGAGSWYDLWGRKVTTPLQKGVYIRDGKKVIVQ